MTNENKSNIPDKGTTQWKKNETTINNNPVLKKARDIREGIKKSDTSYGQTHGGKGSARRNTNDKVYAENWERIFGNKKNVNHQDDEE